MPRGTTRDTVSGIPIAWRRHLADKLRHKDKKLSPLKAELQAQKILERLDERAREG